MRFDGDNDTILLEVDQTEPTCHTGRRSCFYKPVNDNQVIVDSELILDPEKRYQS